MLGSVLSRRGSATATVVVVLILAGALFRPVGGLGQGTTPVPSSPKDLAARVAALETQVAGLAGPTSVPESPPGGPPDAGALPSLDLGNSAVHGNAREFLAMGTPGELSVVASGSAEGFGIPVVVRNNTGRPMAYVGVSAEVRDGDGNLLAAGSGTPLMPIVVPPAEIAIGSVGFSGQALPEGARATFDVSASEDVELYSSGDPIAVELVEFTASPDGIIGSVRNPSSIPIKGIVYLYVACFGEDGTLLAAEPAQALEKDLAPGETSAFRAFGLGVVPSCGRYLVTGYGDSA